MLIERNRWNWFLFLLRFLVTWRSSSDWQNYFGSYFQFVIADSLPKARKQSIFIFCTRKGNFVIPSLYRDQCESFLCPSLSHSRRISPSTPIPCLPPTCPYPSPPHSHQPRSKDSGRFTHTQLHSLVAHLRSGAMIWKSHIDKCEECTHTCECAVWTVSSCVSRARSSSYVYIQHSGNAVPADYFCYSITF